MALRAITFDFWSTLVDGAANPDRAAARLARLHAAIVGAGHEHTIDALRAALERGLSRVAEDARESLLDVGPPGRWAVIAAELGVPPDLIPYEIVERAYEDLTLEPLPAMMPHVGVAVAAMQRAGYRLGVICNTGMAGGRVLREVLRRHGLFDSFDVTVFSNEFGYAKPDPRIFAHTLDALGGVPPSEALHVGDLEELDVEGAQRAGTFSALYLAEQEPTAEIHTAADLIVGDWREFGDQIRAFERSLADRPAR